MLWSHRERAERSEPTLRLWCGTLAAGEAVVIGAARLDGNKDALRRCQVIQDRPMRSGGALESPSRFASLLRT